MQGFLKPREVEAIKKKYPIGTRIELDFMDEKDMPSGLQGEIKFIDDQGQLHMKWQNGRSLALVPNHDLFHVLPPLEQEKAATHGIPDGSIRILVVEPHKAPYVTNIANHYTAMQEIVGGDIEFVPLHDGDCHLYCNDEGKLDGLPGNRRMDNGDILCGTFFICADNGEGNDASLNDEQTARYMERFGAPEQYTDDEAHEFTYTISAAGAVEYLRMLGLVEPEGDSEEFER